MVLDWDRALNEYVSALTANVDCIVMGRKLAEGFIPHWGSNPDLEGAAVMNNTQKIVFTKTLSESDVLVKSWKNTVLAKNDLIEEITRLKNKTGNDIIVYGGATFVSSLIQHCLVDDFHLFINPTAIGKGLPIFDKLTNQQKLRLVKSTPFNCGIVALQYEVKKY